MFRPDLLRYIINAACITDRETSALARGFLFRLVWQADGRLAPQDRSSNDPPPFLDASKFDKALASNQPEVRAAAIMLETTDAGLNRIRFEALSDPNSLVFHTAVASSNVGIKKEWLPYVIKLASWTNPQLKRAAGYLLAASFDPTAKPALHKLAADPDPTIRAAAQFSW